MDNSYSCWICVTLLLLSAIGPSSAGESNKYFKIATTTSSITLSWSADQELGSAVSEWRVVVDGRLVRVLPGSRLTQDGREQLRDVGDGGRLTPGQRYAVSVSFTRPGGINETALEQDVTVNPKPVVNFHMIVRQASAQEDLLGMVFLEWSPANDSLQDSYKVRYSSVIAEPTGQWSNYVYSEIPSVTLTGLVPGNRYRFQVKAYSHGTYSEATTIEESIAPGFPAFVWVDEKKSGPTHFTLYANAPKGIVRGWTISTLRTDQTCCWNDSIGVHMELDSNNNYFTTIYGMTVSGYTYRIKIKALGAHPTLNTHPNEGAERNIMYTSEPTVNSQMSLLEPPTGSTVKLRYTQTRTFFSYYLIELVLAGEDCANDDCPHVRKRRGDDDRVVVFTNLKRATHYVAQLFTVAENDRTSRNAVRFSFQTADDGNSADSSGSSSNSLLPVVIVLAVLLLLLVAAAVLYFVIKRRKGKTPKDEKKSLQLESGQQGERQLPSAPSAVKFVQPVPPLPSAQRPAVLPLANRATSVENEYLEIMPDSGSPGYLNPVQRNISSDSDDYAKPYQVLKSQTQNPVVNEIPKLENAKEESQEADL